jgi:dTDP-4-dehydrorhamnose reductase
MTSEKTDVLVTGASGFLGTKLVETLSSSFSVEGTYHTRPDAGADHCIDLRSPDRIDELLRTVNPDTVVHNAAIVDVAACEAQKESAWETNVTATRRIVDYCTDTETRLVYISTDYVFDGENGPYRPESITEPVNFYGVTKLISETIVRNRLDGGAVVRPTIMYGYNDKQDKTTFVTQLIEGLTAGGSISADDNRQKYPVLIDDVAELVIQIIQKDAEGIFHASGQNQVTRYEWGQKVTDVFDLDDSLLHPTVNDHDVDRPHDVDLVCDRSETLGVSFHDVDAGLRKMKKQLDH